MVSIKGLLIIFLLVLTACATDNKTSKSTADKKADLHYTHGTSQLKNKNYTEALDLLLKANTFRPDDSKILNNLGMAYYFKKDTASAIKFLKKAITIDSKNSDARNNLASIYYNRGALAQAQTQYEIIRKDLLYKSQFRVLYNMALIQFKRGDSVKARSLLRQSLAENESYCPSYYLLGRIHEIARNFEGAYRNFRKSYSGVCFKNPAPHFKAAENLFKMGKYEQAKAKFNDVVELFPTSSFAAKATERVLQLRENNLKNNTSEAYTRRMEKIEEEVKSFESPEF